MTVGGRWYDIENDYTVVQSALTGLNGGIPNCDTDYCYTGANDTGEGKDDGFVPKVNLTYAWTDKLLYFTYSEGFRRGGVNSARPSSIYGSIPGFGGDPLAGAFHEFGSDNVYNWEVGAKTEWLDNTLRFNITAYFMEWEDIQIQVEDRYSEALTFSLGTVNAPEAEIKGVESWLAWAPTDAWDFTGSLSYNEGELSKDFFFPDEDGDLLAPKGTDLPLMPDWKASLNAQYTFAGELLSASPYILAQYVYWGESVNSIGVESSNFAFPVKEQPAWQTLALRVGLDGETWSAVAYVDNIFDEYQENFYNNRWAQQRLSVGQPRTFGVGFRLKFGD
jgi:outer membrane receptor protein involved in Fe transport